MIIQDPNLLNKLQELRQKAVAGTITLEEVRDSIKMLRGNRTNAAEAAASSGKGKKKATGPAKSAGDLLAELDGLGS